MSNGWQIPEIVQVNLAIRTRVAVVSVHEKIEKKSERKSLAEATLYHKNYRDVLTPFAIFLQI